MKHLKKISLIILVSIIVLLSACSPAQITDVQTNTASVEVIPGVTKATGPTIAPTLTLTSAPTVTDRSTCPQVDSNVQFELPTDALGFDVSILNYLNHGGDPAKIEAATLSPELPPFGIAYTDIDGDFLPELVVTTSNLYEKQATIRIYHCGENDYRLVKSFTPQNMGFGKIELVTKVFSSDPVYVIIRASYAIGWGQNFLAAGWHNSEWQIINLATGSSPSQIALFDQNMDGIKEVLLETRTAATPGGGISRLVIDTFTWDGKKFVDTSSVVPPGNNRIHYLDDAETAWKNGNPLLAIHYYETAAYDPDLSSYWTTYEWEHKQTELAKPYQQAFAFFRIVATWLYLDRPDLASNYIQDMVEAFPKGKPGYEFVQAVLALSNWYDKDPDFTRSCAQAINLLETQYPDIVPNHLGGWGVANPMYFATSDICKFK